MTPLCCLILRMRSSTSAINLLIQMKHSSDEEMDEETSLLVSPKLPPSCKNNDLFEAVREYLQWEESYLTAVIFINIFCVFDTLDNICAKESEVLKVNYLDLAFARISFNFVMALGLVYWYNSDIYQVPLHFRSNLLTRSMMQFFSQGANVFSIALLPFGTIQIV